MRVLICQDLKMSPLIENSQLRGILTWGLSQNEDMFNFQDYTSETYHGNFTDHHQNFKMIKSLKS